ncbi:MAG: hypothetical protein JEZ06_22940 [Anaerolineaceae bacterium]|nr:hypothetical protein [Anaerolineaceae bacterium]
MSKSNSKDNTRKISQRDFFLVFICIVLILIVAFGVIAFNPFMAPEIFLIPAMVVIGLLIFVFSFTFLEEGREIKELLSKKEEKI